MGDHFVLLVDRLLTESTLEAAIFESRNLLKQSTDVAADDIEIDLSSYDRDSRDCSSPRKIVECRICQDEDENSNMDTPCSCCGSLKLSLHSCASMLTTDAYRGGVMRRPFKPGYTAPPPMFQIGRIPVNFRGNWEISRRDLNNSRFIAVVSPDRNFIDPESDEYAASTARSEFCCRSFMILLVLRHVLPVIFSERVDYSLPLFLLLLLRACGVILPIYIILRAVNAIQSCRRHQESPEISDTPSDEEAGLPTLPHQAGVMRIH
ncbi:hypothetical protein RHSIM_Rhsim09G0068500 [Rhododendron simsii]|uniref:RING-CH-type domain-containing protein n=1 Tax=Rhododendron simsii TaxID=118357 RepID=A0A834GGK7_RHOSS|nr:hypothetical protein RHSIM_Rhsim09G0068500 [Rhododendron simsii]